MLNQTRVSSANDVQVQIVNLLGNSQNSIYDMFFFFIFIFAITMIMIFTVNEQ